LLGKFGGSVGDLTPAARLEKPVWICEAKILIRVAAAQHAKPETPKPESDDPR
jgi:hypothetical protein